MVNAILSQRDISFPHAIQIASPSREIRAFDFPADPQEQDHRVAAENIFTRGSSKFNIKHVSSF